MINNFLRTVRFTWKKSIVLTIAFIMNAEMLNRKHSNSVRILFLPKWVTIKWQNKNVLRYDFLTPDLHHQSDVMPLVLMSFKKMLGRIFENSRFFLVLVRVLCSDFVENRLLDKVSAWSLLTFSLSVILVPLFIVAPLKLVHGGCDLAFYVVEETLVNAGWLHGT